MRILYSIRGRILIAFIALCFLITPFLIFSFNSLKKIDNIKSLREQVALFNSNRLKSANKFAQILDHDTKIDSFYTFKTTKNLNAYWSFSNHTDTILANIRVLENGSNNVFGQRIDKISANLFRLKEKTASVIGLQQQRGFKDFGIEGEMRKHIHSLESESNGISLAENLMLRRREKDYFLRDDHSYVLLLNSECNALKRKLAENLKSNTKTLAALENYQSNFNRIVELENEIGNEKKGLLHEVVQLGISLDKEVAKLYNIVDTDTKILVDSIKSYIALFFAITVIFAFLFAFTFSNHIARPIKRLILDMDSIIKNDFKGKQKVKTNIKINELKKLTRTYNGLVEKIRYQIEYLNANNDALMVLNNKLKTSEDELKEASRLKDKFFSIISHDLRGHSGNVLTLANMLNEAKLDKEEKKIFTQYLADASQNLQLLLDNLLNWAKSQMNDHTLVKRSFNIIDLIEENKKLFEDNAYRKGVRVYFKMEEVQNAYADKDMIDFVVRNLLSNALKFTTKGDTITFTIEEKRRSLEINIIDTGVGMTEDQIQLLLQSKTEGFTTRGTENEEGTGLGLSICKDFVKRNGGTLTIVSKKNEGSTFTFTVPTSLTRESILTV